MFSKFAGFWIKNQKLSFIIIILILLAGAFSWFIIPKQYNPDIVVPAYQITIPAPGYSSEEIKNLIINPLENKLFEIEGVEHIYGYAAKDFGTIMLSFKVGEEKEKATTRVYNKLNSNMDQKPLGVGDIQVKAVDPDEIPIFNIAIAYTSGENTEYAENIAITLRKLALEVSEELKHISEVSNLYTIGGQKESISIKVDPLLLEAKNIDLLQIIDLIKKNNINLPAGNINFDENQAAISIQGKLDSVIKIQKLVIANHNGLPVYLEDVATISKGIAQYTSQTVYANAKINSGALQNAVYLGLAKKKGSNAVTVTQDIQEKIEQIKELLPNGYEVFLIQDEGETAKNTTNMLLINLVQSIIIVILILSIFLGFRNSLNVAISIPLTLSVIFLFALIIGDNVNRITLFALILVLGMLVDDATVVVENVNRNLAMRSKTGKRKLEAIFDAIAEVELGVVLSTITRLLAFGAMFFVSGMMGLYMGPIPKYAIVAMITSTFVALSINPFLAHVFSEKLKINKKVIKQEQNKKNKFSNKLYKKTLIHTKKITKVIYTTIKMIQNKLNFEHIPKIFKERYMNMLNHYLGEEKIKEERRKKFKKRFFIILGLIVILPPMLGIFKMRMLPKSNQNQIYIRLDNSPDTNIKSSLEITEDLNAFLSNYMVDSNLDERQKQKIIKDQSIISSISYRVGEAPTPDFSNLFRGAAARQFEHHISLRVNLIDKSKRKISSEDFVITLRPALEQYIQSKHPGLQIRLLEDPPGPPVRATFLLKVSGEETTKYETLEDFAGRLKDKLLVLFEKNSVEEVYTSKERYKTNFKLVLDHEILSRLGLSAQQVAHTVNTAFMGQNVSMFQEKNNLESTNIYISLDESYKNHMNAFQYISITAANGKKIPLLEIVKLEPNKLDKGIFSDDKKESVYIFGEMGNNSVIYPMIDLYNQLRKDSFRDEKYSFDSMSFYGITIKDKLNNDKIEIKFGGERELTIDTFRDLGLAMIVAFLAIYFMMIAQFKNFKVAGVIMTSFLLGFFGVFPGFTILYLFGNEYFSATSMIGVIALAGIVVGNAIILVEYINILLKRGRTKKGAIIDAARTRLKPIFVTSLTTILGATTVLGDPVRGGLALAIIFGLTASAALTPIVIPIMLYDKMEEVD